MRRTTYEHLNTNVLVIQRYVSGKFSTGRVRHQLLAGVDINRKKFISYSGSGDPTANQTLYPLDANNPIYGISFDANVRTGALSDIATDQQSISYQAVYVQDELVLFENKLRVTLGTRLTFSETGVQKIPTKTSLGETKNTAFTPEFGLSYSLMRDFSVYALYDQTFTPQSGVNTTSGDAFKPLKGENLEAGLKKDWMGGKWNTTVSLYRIISDNVKVTDPSTNIQTQLGQTTSKGVEFNLKGEIVKGLNTVINYAYLKYGALNIQRLPFFNICQNFISQFYQIFDIIYINTITIPYRYSFFIASVSIDSRMPSSPNSAIIGG